MHDSLFGFVALLQGWSCHLLMPAVPGPLAWRSQEPLHAPFLETMGMCCPDDNVYACLLRKDKSTPLGVY